MKTHSSQIPDRVVRTKLHNEDAIREAVDAISSSAVCLGAHMQVIRDSIEELLALRWEAKDIRRGE